MSATAPPAVLETVSGYKLLRELGSRSVRTFAARAPKADAVVVVEHLTRSNDATPEEIAAYVRTARALTQLSHRNVGRVREALIGADGVLVVSDFVDGERMDDLARAARDAGTPLPLAVTVRILADVLAGLAALHDLRDAKRDPLKLVHGEVCPSNVIVGVDGVARVTHACNRVSESARLARPPEITRYVAPELLLGDQMADQRADVYSVGAMLWEALAGRPLHPEGDAGAIVVRLLGGRIARPRGENAPPWADALADVALKALVAEPAKRFATAAAMLDEVQRIAGVALATPSAMRDAVGTIAAPRIAARRATLGGTSRSAERALLAAIPTPFVPLMPVQLIVDVGEARASKAPPLPAPRASAVPDAPPAKAAPAPRPEPNPAVTMRGGMTSPAPLRAAPKVPSPLPTPASKARESVEPLAATVPPEVPVAPPAIARTPAEPGVPSLRIAEPPAAPRRRPAALVLVALSVAALAGLGVMGMRGGGAANGASIAALDQPAEVVRSAAGAAVDAKPAQARTPTTSPVDAPAPPSPRVTPPVVDPAPAAARLPPPPSSSRGKKPRNFEPMGI